MIPTIILCVQKNFKICSCMFYSFVKGNYYVPSTLRNTEKNCRWKIFDNSNIETSNLKEPQANSHRHENCKNVRIAKVAHFLGLIFEISTSELGNKNVYGIR